MEKPYFSELEKNGINVHAGLVYAGGDEKLYAEILQDFAYNMKRNKSVISGLFSQKDIKNYGVKVHALKGIARTIGAAALSEKAKALEEAAKENDVAFIEENHMEMITEYEGLAKRLKKWCADFPELIIGKSTGL